MNTLEILKEYSDRGWRPIPVPHGEKGPKDDEWQKIDYEVKDFNGNKNIGVQMGPRSGGLTDVDLDCPEAIKLADDFLPATGAVFGRQSKPRSHYLYSISDPDPKGSIKLSDDNKKSIIELRMGGGGKGAQTVFPGSTHESGEKVEWVKNGEPAKTTCAILKAANVKIAMATLLARKWPASNRHDAALRVGGFLARAGWEPDAIGTFMVAVQRAAGVTDHTHIEGGKKAAVDAATTHLQDGKGYGLPAIIEFFGEEVAKLMAKWLEYQGHDYVELLERMNEQFCVVSIAGKARVLEFETIGQRKVAVLSSFENFKQLQDNKKAGKIGVGTWWLNQSERRQFAGLIFKPLQPSVINGRLNLWRGWGVEPQKGKWPLLKAHIENVIAGGDGYPLKWTAWTFQNPGSPPEVVLVLRGGKGSGKGVFARAIKSAFGQHGIHISSGDQLAGKFNRHLMDCVLLFADEAYWPGDKKAEGGLKRLTTEPTLWIEPKGLDSFEVDNNLHVIVAGNAEWVVPASMDERRFAVFDVTNSKIGNKKYFTALYHEIENGGLAAMMFDLLAMDLKGWHPRYDVPQNDALREQQLHSLLAGDQWWYELLTSGQLPGAYGDNPRRTKSADLSEHARKSVPGLRFHSDHMLGRILTAHGCRRCKVKGVRGWEAPSLTEARAAWTKRLPGTKWDEQAEWEVIKF